MAKLKPGDTQVEEVLKQLWKILVYLVWICMGLAWLTGYEAVLWS